MNLQNQLPANIYVIAADVTDTDASSNPVAHPIKGTFFSITCTVAGTVKVTGGGVYKYVDVDDSTSVHQNVVDPDTGKAFASNAAMDAHGDGFFESLSTVEVDMPMIAGQTIYGRFDFVRSDGTFTGFAYAG